MNSAVKVLLTIALLALAVVVLFAYIFPWVERNFITDPTLALLLRV